MRIIVLSDTHGNPKVLETILARHADADACIHLGDGEGRHAVPGDEANDRLAKGHGGVHAHAAKDEQAHADAKRPSGDREHVAGVAVLTALERDIAVHADAEDDHEGGRGEFGEEVVDHGVPFGGRFV